ncbi:MAG: DUF4349 domain-containing protein [bacterium]|nr:DUF4349 domain-containing protein [bacterium]
MNNDQSTPKSFLPWRLSWLTIVLALLAIGAFIAISGSNRGYIRGYISTVGFGGGYSDGKGVPPASSDQASTMMETAASNGVARDMMYPYPYPSPDVPVTDTREFLKIYYNASMRTRDVQGLTRRVETTVRGYDGRVDQESSSPKYGYVSFAVPQSKYEAFRIELESLVTNRFITINISSQNLLSQKVSIEEQQKQADTTLSDYKMARQKIVNAHASAVQSLQGKIDADTGQLTTLRAQPSTPQILVEIQRVSDDLILLKKQLVNENASYTTQLRNADANIKYAEDWQKAVQTQDQALLANIATVTGTISIQWVSLWDIALLYLPGYWIPAIFTTLAFLSYLRDRRRLLVTIS